MESFVAFFDLIKPLLLALLIAAGVWAIAEVALTIRRLRGTLDEVDKSVAKVEPLVEHATLTIDALNLEIMRLDQILEDVGEVTDVATSATSVISSIASGPANAANTIAGKLRGGIKALRRGQKSQAALEQVAKPVEPAAALEAPAEPAPKAEPAESKKADSVVIEASPAK
ncbi:MAG: hypothetical protein IJH83_05390 [Coriobacteriales bacterium]|nr:hypothetical protein [Coriobacteriales bacterium]